MAKIMPFPAKMPTGVSVSEAYVETCGNVLTVMHAVAAVSPFPLMRVVVRVGCLEMNVDRFLNAVRANAEKAGVFAEVKLDRGMIKCLARDAAEEAWYRIEPAAHGGWSVSLVTPNRWLSESIEADLMHHGDPIEELIEEELVELGHAGEPLPVKHFRSDDMLYTFVSPLPIAGSQSEDQAAQTATTCLLAYEAAFRELGDMSGGEDE